jgi:hypothetical protein
MAGDGPRHWTLLAKLRRVLLAVSRFQRCSYNSGSVVTIDAGLSARSFNF